MSAIGDARQGTVCPQHIQCIVRVNIANLISCEQVVEYLKQPRTKAAGFVWCQRAHPDTSRIKIKLNAKVSAIVDIGERAVCPQHIAAYSMHCSSEHSKFDVLVNRL